MNFGEKNICFPFIIFFSFFLSLSFHFCFKRTFSILTRPDGGCFWKIYIALCDFTGISRSATGPDPEERNKTGGPTIQECEKNLLGLATGPDPDEREKTGGHTIQECEENLLGPATGPDPDEREKTGGPTI